MWIFAGFHVFLADKLQPHPPCLSRVTWSTAAHSGCSAVGSVMMSTCFILVSPLGTTSCHLRSALSEKQRWNKKPLADAQDARLLLPCCPDGLALGQHLQEQENHLSAAGGDVPGSAGEMQGSRHGCVNNMSLPVTCFKLQSLKTDPIPSSRRLFPTGNTHTHALLWSYHCVYSHQQ